MPNKNNKTSAEVSHSHLPLQFLVRQERLEHLQVVRRRIRVVNLEVFVGQRLKELLAEAEDAAADAAVRHQNLDWILGAGAEVACACCEDGMTTSVSVSQIQLVNATSQELSLQPRLQPRTATRPHLSPH